MTINFIKNQLDVYLCVPGCYCVKAGLIAFGYHPIGRIPPGGSIPLYDRLSSTLTKHGLTKNIGPWKFCRHQGVRVTPTVRHYFY